MLSEKIKNIRDEKTEKYDFSHLSHPSCYRDGFDAAWELHKKLVAPLLAVLENNGYDEFVEDYKKEVGE